MTYNANQVLSKKRISTRLTSGKLKSLAKSRQLGAVYTPPELAKWTANLLMRYLGSKKNMCIVDPAVGDGALLKAVQGVAASPSIFGVDIDSQAILQARKNLGRQIKLIKSDALIYSPHDSVPKSWKQMAEGKKIDGIIANPPWGIDLTHSPSVLRDYGYTLARGQFDSFELFIELAINVLDLGGVAAFIIPDSIFQPEHKPLRELLLRKTALLFIARLGEGFFDEVCRGASVIVFRKHLPHPLHKVTCLRLNKYWRDSVLQGAVELSLVETKLSHRVLQRRFTEDAEMRFDIDCTEKERARVSIIERHINGWTSWLDSTRGVELSKGGSVIYCENCGSARPMPRNVEKWQCYSCGSLAKIKDSKFEKIVVSTRIARKGWRPFIVGEDVDRYSVIPSRCIKADVHGINYKNEDVFEGKKLVIRKTGIGIKAAIDSSGAYTNQVVFIFKPNRHRQPPSFILEYFQGVLCSRIMLAYYLKKNGENEWRSHPYLTQKIISELPVPDIHEGSWQWQQAKAISDAVRQYMKNPTVANDCKIEQFVAGMYGLKSSDFRWAMGVLNDAQALEPIRTLRLPDALAIDPIRV